MVKSFSYRDLDIWKLALVLAETVYVHTEAFPKSEEFGLKGQLRRAAVSVSANIAEGWGYGSQAVLSRHIHIARGSLAQVDSLSHVAQRLGLIDEIKVVELQSQLDTLGRKTHAFLAKVESNIVREDVTAYNSPSDPESGLVARHASLVTTIP